MILHCNMFVFEHSLFINNDNRVQNKYDFKIGIANKVQSISTNRNFRDKLIKHNSLIMPQV